MQVNGVYNLKRVNVSSRHCRTRKMLALSLGLLVLTWYELDWVEAFRSFFDLLLNSVYIN